MRVSGYTSELFALDSRQQWFVARPSSKCKTSKSKVLYDYPTPSALVGRKAITEHVRIRRGEMMRWPEMGEEPEVKPTILEDDAAAQRATAVGLNGNHWMVFRSYIGMGWIHVFDTKLWAIRVAL